MNYQNTLEFARQCDHSDPLSHFREKFHFPQQDGKKVLYFCGNSLGLQPKAALENIEKEMRNWADRAVGGWFSGDNPWIGFPAKLKPALKELTGAANEMEIAIGNTLSVNLHLMLASFYQPQGKKIKILMESREFPSDLYAVESQVAQRNHDPKEAIVKLRPREGEQLICTEDILQIIERQSDELALILLGGVNYLTGQCFDMQKITEAAHAHGILVGFDLAHAIGNVPLNLHEWQVDFAVWCSYKYLNSGPGGVGGIFVHQKHHGKSFKRLAGWWGYQPDEKFLMKPHYRAAEGAEGWLVSASPVWSLAAHKTALDLHMDAGMENLREKSIVLTGFLEFVVNDVNKQLNKKYFSVLSPANADERGCQLSILAHEKAPEIFKTLQKQQVVGDWREPNVMRFAPVPLYNSFEEVYNFGQLLLKITKRECC